MASMLPVRRSRPLLAACLLLGLCASSAAQPTAPASAGPPDPKLIEDLVAANRILADQGLLDGWGHVSVRHDKNPNRFLMARGVAAQLVTPQDIIEFDLDSRPVDTHGLPLSALFTERYIHGEIYKLRPDVIAVVHTHAPSLIPFGDTKVPLQPMYHRSAFIAFGVPVFEIRERAGMTDMLIRNQTLGRNLAEALGDHPAVLMRGHGAAITGPSLPRVVSRTIFLSLNATLQAEAMRMGAPITYMDIEEARLIEAREGHGLARTWEGWKQKAMGKPQRPGNIRRSTRSRRTTWINVVTACSDCNLRKGNLTPPKAKMYPSQMPFQPMVSYLHRNGRAFPPNYLHESWLDYLYWDTELEP